MFKKAHDNPCTLQLLTWEYLNPFDSSPNSEKQKQKLKQKSQQTKHMFVHECCDHTFCSVNCLPYLVLGCMEQAQFVSPAGTSLEELSRIKTRKF